MPKSLSNPDPHVCFECSYECSCGASDETTCLMCSTCLKTKSHISQWWVDQILQQFYRGIIEVHSLDKVVDQMNKTKRIAMLARLNQGMLDAGLEPPNFKIGSSKLHPKPISSSRLRQLVRMFEAELKLAKLKPKETQDENS